MIFSLRLSAIFRHQLTAPQEIKEEVEREEEMMEHRTVQEERNCNFWCGSKQNIEILPFERTQAERSFQSEYFLRVSKKGEEAAKTEWRNENFKTAEKTTRF